MKFNPFSNVILKRDQFMIKLLDYTIHVKVKYGNNNCFTVNYDSI